MASSFPIQAGVDTALRATDEYAAAFDLEVWKAQQQLRYQAQLRQAKEQLERRLRKEARESEKTKMAELERLRQELEAMGHRLQIAGETLERRAAQLDAREAAFNVKRVKVAEQHEAYVTRAEELARRTREEAQLAQSSLQARLQEKERLILQLQEKVSTTQQEYDLLRRRAARHLAEQTDTDGLRLREQECALVLAQTQLAETQQLLRDRNGELMRLTESKSTLEQQLHEAKRQLSIVSRKYRRLSEGGQTREWERLRREQETLRVAQETHAVQSQRQELQLQRQALLNSLLPGGARDVALPLGGEASATGTASRAVGRRQDDLYAMVAGLRQDVAAELAAAKRAAQLDAVPFTIVERPAPAAPSRSSETQHRGTAAEGHLRALPQARLPAAAAADAPRAESGDKDALFLPARGGALETSSVSGVSRIAPVASSSQPPSPSRAWARPEAASPAAAAGVANVVVDMGDTSIDSAYPGADMQSWTTSMLVAGDDDAAREDRYVDVAALPPARAGTLPPLAPAALGGGDAAALEASMPSQPSGTDARVSPSPEEFVLSRSAPLLQDGSGSDAATAAARRDMQAFVHQLRMNRAKLLETGVYTEQDRVVVEMGEKIKLYEQYLAQQR